MSTAKAENLQTLQIRLSLKGNIPKLKSIQNAKPNHVVTIAPLMTLSELNNLCRERFGVPDAESKGNAAASSSSSSKRKGKAGGNVVYGLELWVGFPPKKIDMDSAGSGQTLVTANGVQNGDSITVKIEKKTRRSSTKDSGGSNKNEGTCVNGSGGNGNSRKRQRPSELSPSTYPDQPDSSSKNENGSNVVEYPRAKRAAALAASDSFKDTIRAQDKMIRDEKKKKSKTTKQKSSTSSASRSVSQSAATRKRAAEARAAAATSRKFASLKNGRRLDGSEDGGDTGSNNVNQTIRNKKKEPPRRSSSSIFEGLNSKDDISFALLSSIHTDTGVSQKGKISKVLRSAMRKTVEKSYEASRAVVRCSALGSGKITFMPCSSLSSNTNNMMGTYTVKYPKGIEGSGFYEEQVHIITIEMLKAVIESVHADHEIDDNDVGSDDIPSMSGREMLKPTNMALLSPRVFWSLFFHFHQNFNSSGNSQHACPTIEGALERLHPHLDWSFLHHRSRKLSEKARENLRQKRSQEHHVGSREPDAGVRAVQVVEEAMEQMYDKNVADTRERAANAALARFEQASKNTTTWIFETPSEFDDDELRDCLIEGIDGLSDEDIGKYVTMLTSKCSVNNWRMLANCAANELLLQLKEEKTDSAEILTIENIEACISAAQTRTIDEVMMEILDGNEDLLHVLNEEASCGTPKDLSLFIDAPELLCEGVSSTTALNNMDIGEDVMKDYCKRASKAVTSLQWLDSYTTSVLG